MMPDSTSPSTRKELEEAIDQLLRAAHQNGVDMNNHAYALRHSDPETPDWEVLITRVVDR